MRVEIDISGCTDAEWQDFLRAVWRLQLKGEENAVALVLPLYVASLFQPED